MFYSCVPVLYSILLYSNLLYCVVLFVLLFSILFCCIVFDSILFYSVSVKPVIAYGSPSVDVVIGRDVKLSCVVLAGNPTPKIIWTRLGEPVTSNDPDVIDDLSGNLILKSVKTYDEGEYICVASNVGGNDSNSFLLNVQGSISRCLGYTQVPSDY